MELEQICRVVVENPVLHAKFLNSLSYMENAGARKISACEHPQQVNLIQLKHAAEEHRHAYYLKKQIDKIAPQLCPTYRDHELLAATATASYLNRLDCLACRYLKKTFELQGTELQYAAYLFVTHAIEVRADTLYPIYQRVLTECNSPVMVKSIILEEAGHLEEMIVQLKAFSLDWEQHTQAIMELEEALFQRWIAGLKKELQS